MSDRCRGRQDIPATLPAASRCRPGLRLERDDHGSPLIPLMNLGAASSRLPSPEPHAIFALSFSFRVQDARGEGARIKCAPDHGTYQPPD